MSRPPVKFHWRGIHHSYLGFFLGVLPGSLFIYLNWGNNLDFLNPIYWFMLIAGIYLIIDDLIEHTITEDTPARIIWNKMLRK